MSILIPKSALLSFPREVDANENEYRNLQKKKHFKARVELVKGIHPPWRSRVAQERCRQAEEGEEEPAAQSSGLPLAAECQAATQLRDSVGLNGLVYKMKPPEVACSSNFLCFQLWFFSLMCNCRFWPIVPLNFGHMVDEFLVLWVNARRGQSNGMPNTIETSSL